MHQISIHSPKLIVIFAPNVRALVINKSIILNEYISVDNGLITGDALTIKEIVACVHDTSNENDEMKRS